MKFIVDNIVTIFFVFYILVAVFGSTPEKKQDLKQIPSHSYEIKDEYEFDETIEKEYKKKVIKQEIKRLEEEYDNLEFDMSPSKLREWIRNEIRNAVQPK